MIEGLPPPYGQPDGPVRGRDELVEGFLDGQSRGSADIFSVEGELLSGRDVALAIRVPAAGTRVALVRNDCPGEAAEAREVLTGLLHTAGMRCVEELAVLGHVVGIEVAGLRGSEWDLWADDADAGRAALATRALGEIADHIDFEEPARRAATDEQLHQIERGLWPDDGPAPER